MSTWRKDSGQDIVGNPLTNYSDFNSNFTFSKEIMPENLKLSEITENTDESLIKNKRARCQIISFDSYYRKKRKNN